MNDIFQRFSVAMAAICKPVEQLGFDDARLGSSVSAMWFSSVAKSESTLLAAEPQYYVISSKPNTRRQFVVTRLFWR
jgi:hypothetical protein